MKLKFLSKYLGGDAIAQHPTSMEGSFTDQLSGLMNWRPPCNGENLTIFTIEFKEFAWKTLEIRSQGMKFLWKLNVRPPCNGWNILTVSKQSHCLSKKRNLQDLGLDYKQTNVSSTDDLEEQLS